MGAQFRHGIYTLAYTVQNVLCGGCPKGQRLITEMAAPQKLHVTLAPLLFPPTVSLLTRPQTSPIPLLNIRCTRLSPYPDSFCAEGGRTWSTGKGGRGGGRPTAAASLSLSLPSIYHRPLRPSLIPSGEHSSSPFPIYADVLIQRTACTC